MNDSLVQVLTLLAQGVGVGATLSFLFEHIKWFQAQTPELKWWIVLGLSLLLPVLAQVAVSFIPDTFWEAIEPFWQALVAGFLIWAGSQGTHILVNKKNGN